MLDVAGKTDDRSLAVDERRIRQHLQGLLNQQFAEPGAQGDEIRKIVYHFAGERIADHRASRGPRDRPHRRKSTFAVDGVADDKQSANFHAYLPVRRGKLTDKASSAFPARRPPRTTLTRAGLSRRN